MRLAIWLLFVFSVALLVIKPTLAERPPSSTVAEAQKKTDNSINDLRQEMDALRAGLEKADAVLQRLEAAQREMKMLQWKERTEQRYRKEQKLEPRDEKRIVEPKYIPLASG